MWKTHNVLSQASSHCTRSAGTERKERLICCKTNKGRRGLGVVPRGSKDVWLTNACTYRGMPHDFLFLDCITFRTSDALSANMYIYTNMCASFLSRWIRGAQYGRHRFTTLQRGNSFFFLCVFWSRALSNSTACSSFLGA